MMTAEQINEYVAWIKFEHGLIKVCDSDDPKAFPVYKWATVESHAAAQLAEKEREPFDKPEPGEWIQPQANDYLMRCCDCGLTHAMDFRIYEGRVQFRAYRVGNPPPPKCSFCGEFRGHKEDCWTVETVEKLQEAQADLKADDLDMSVIACEIGSCDATREDIVKRIRALRQREAELEQRWIAVGERLPRIAELPCLYIDRIGKHQIGRPIQYDKFWMPLAAIPSPPKEANS